MKIAAPSAPVIVVLVISPSIPSSTMPLRPAPIDFAVADRDAAPVRKLDQAALLGQGLAAAVEDDAGKQDVIGAARDDDRRVVGREDARRAGHADEPCAGRQHEAAGTVDAGREDERQPRARCAVDRTLQRFGLVLAAVEAHAEMDGFNPEP